MVYSKKGYKKVPVWQWIVLYLIIGGVVYASFYYAFIGNKPNYLQTPTADSMTPGVEKATFKYQTTGFSPQSLTVKVGQTVTWTNDGGDLDLASSPHPSHTDYTKLNLGIIKKGESKTLSFPTAGVYKFHNHLNAGQYGSITVQ